MASNEIYLNTASFYPFNLLGIGLVRVMAEKYGFNKRNLEYMPVNIDGRVREQRQHASWRGEGNLASVFNTLKDGGLKFGLSASTYFGMPLANESLLRLDKNKPTVIFEEQERLARTYGFSKISIQPKNLDPKKFEDLSSKGISFTLDTQHTQADTWAYIRNTQPSLITGCHIRSGNDLPSWKRDLQSIYHGDIDGPLRLVEQLPQETVLVSEISLVAIAMSGLAKRGRVGEVYKIVNANISAAASNRR